MARSLILFTLLVMAYSIQVKINECTCEQVLKQDECDEYPIGGGIECDWNEEKKVCESYRSVECSILKGSEICRGLTSCGWVNGKCVNFKQCSDYQETVDQKCNDINYTCILIKDDQCGKVSIPECESFTPELCKNTSEQICVLSGSPAKCVTMKKCEQGSYNQSQCKKNLISCIWENDKCRDKKCTDIQTKDACRFISSFDQYTATLCQWTAQGDCIERNEDDFTENNCFYDSACGRVWKDGKCQSCSASPDPDPDPPAPIPSYHQILSIIMLLLAIII
ncbi:unnamed protein product [Paramecium sonneborni]|uniref:Uncharacterized protein n=1 Tax=Paramecium sonneborni TaxID=65129 RepID=A0A8S1RD39_9CILI|nr:unnamed protein product [Paramecium sonneborni]